MAKVVPIPAKAILVDIGGVLLTDGWNRHSRRRVAKKFGLDLAGLEDRHHMNLDIYETGKLSLKDYLDRVVFYQKRSFTRKQFWSAMVAESKPYPEMIAMIRDLKLRHKLKIGVLSNEAREMNAYRVRKFQLDTFVDFFISSSFVHLRKPDIEIFQMALDISQVPAKQIVYIENTSLFVQLAQGLGISSILHVDCESTRAHLAALGLQTDDRRKDLS